MSKRTLALAAMFGVLACGLVAIGIFMGSVLLSHPTTVTSPPSTRRATNPPTGRLDASGTTDTRLSDNLAAAESALRPPRDQYALAERLKGVSVRPTTTPPVPPIRVVGQRETFWVGDQAQNQHFQVTATLQYVTEHAYFYVDTTISYEPAKLKASAEVFEQRTLPTSLRLFGNTWRAGLDGDRRLTVLNTLTPGAGGYYSAADEYPREVNRFSNERKMVYIDVKSYPIGSTRYDGVLAHEFQHAIHWLSDPEEDAWVNEGLSELSMRLNGFPTSRADQAFARQPDTQLNTWGDDLTNEAVHYGASYLFLSYFYQRFGDEALRDLVAEPKHGIEGFNAVLARRAQGLQFEDVFRDWVVANYLDDPRADDGKYGYKDLDIRAATAESLPTLPAMLAGDVRQFAAQYIEVTAQASEALLSFTGTTQVSLLGVPAHSGDSFWWSNRGDSMDSSLTRSVDLTGLTTATLSYWAWYDIEKDWDYAYALISTDGGARWTSLRTQRTTDADPIGQNYGNGYTGKSDGWVQEQVDLTPYAGRRVLLRFEYVTDEEVNNAGFALDDVCLVQTQQCDDAETPGDWEAQGFVRVGAWLPQRFSAQVIRFTDGASVEQLPLNDLNQGALVLRDLGGASRRAVIVVSGLTPVTTEPAHYELAIVP